MTSISVDALDPTPPFEQIRKQLARMIDAEELSVGQRLPTVRQLAADLQVAPGTVSRAFKELEATGYIETRRSAGTRVRARQQLSPRDDLMALARHYVGSATHLGATDAEITDAVATVLADKLHPLSH